MYILWYSPPFCFYYFELKSWLYREWRRTQWWSTLLCQTQTVVEVWFKWISQIVKYLNWSCFSAVDVAAAAAAVVTPSSERLFEIFRENEYDSSTPEIIYCTALFLQFYVLWNACTVENTFGPLLSICLLTYFYPHCCRVLIWVKDAQESKATTYLFLNPILNFGLRCLVYIQVRFVQRQGKKRLCTYKMVLADMAEIE